MMLNKKKVLVEANCGATSKYIVDAIIASKHEPIGCDIYQNTFCFVLGYDSFVVPRGNDESFWDSIPQLITKYKITDVIPTLHETLLGWSKKKEHFKDLGCTIHISPPSTLEIFLDKWTTFNFFKENKLPTPNTSLDNIYPLTKPRSGRGAIGMQLNKVDREMTGLISQEVCLGREVTIDVFVYNNKPLYIVPRNRDKIVSGKSTASSIFKNDKIEEYINKICNIVEFSGPFNLQGFIKGGDIKFTELNPRLGGGTALAFAATENWIQILLNGLPNNWKPKKISYNLNMTRFYHEYFFKSL